MILSDRDISREMSMGVPLINPFNQEHLQPASIDVRLSNEFREFNRGNHYVIDPKTDMDLSSPRVADSLFINPGEFMLGCTIESLNIPQHIVARVEGKSSLGRLGLLVHATAGFVDPGFVGQITLELNNVNKHPIILYSGMKIAQISFMYTNSRASLPYGANKLKSKYQGQTGPVPSRYFQNFIDKSRS